MNDIYLARIGGFHTVAASRVWESVDGLHGAEDVIYVVSLLSLSQAIITMFYLTLNARSSRWSMAQRIVTSDWTLILPVRN